MSFRTEIDREVCATIEEQLAELQKSLDEAKQAGVAVFVRSPYYHVMPAVELEFLYYKDGNRIKL